MVGAIGINHYFFSSVLLVMTNIFFNQYTQLLKGTSNTTKPSLISELPYAEEVACGGYHTCVLTSNHQVLNLHMCWFVIICLLLHSIWCLLHRFWWTLYLGFKWKWLPWHRVSFLFLKLVTLSFSFSTFPFPHFSFFQVFWFFKSFLSRSSYAIHLPEKVQGPFLESSVVQVSCGWKHTAAISGKFFSSYKRQSTLLLLSAFSC